jgi:RNA polymerase-binding transcription factor DksA
MMAIEQGPDYSWSTKALKARLPVLREEIRSALLRVDAERYGDIAGQVHDMKDQSLAAALAGVTDAEIARDVTEVADIEAALQRLAAGAYGKCIDCGTQIPRARLEAYPTAKRCQPCQRAHEAKTTR